MDNLTIIIIGSIMLNVFLWIWGSGEHSKGALAQQRAEVYEETLRNWSNDFEGKRGAGSAWWMPVAAVIAGLLINALVR